MKKETNKEVNDLKLVLETQPFKPIESPFSKFKLIKDKEGNKISISEFFKRWGEGIKNLTPLQKLSNESRATTITLIGSIVCIVALILYREKLIVSWFAYGLILVFVGNAWNTGLKLVGIRQQLRYFKGINQGSINIEDLLEGGNE